MKKLIVPAAALALSLMTVSVGWAQADEPADCASAVTALNQADAAHRDAVDADQKLADAEKADDVLRDARRDLKDAQDKRDVASADVTAKQAELSRLNAEDTDSATPPGTKVGTPEQIAAAQTALDQAKKTLKNREDRVDDRQKAVDRAEKDAKTDVGDLRRKADKTDAAELQKALDEARADFDRLCGGVTTTPSTPAPAPEEDLDCADFPLSSGRTAQQVLDETPGEDPHGLDSDGDRRACEAGEDTAADGSDLGDNNDVTINNNVAVPSGGVATGGGPAWAFE